MIGVAINAIAHHLNLQLKVVLSKAATNECEGAFPESVNVLRRKKKALKNKEAK
jgi:hypothetical protein